MHLKSQLKQIQGAPKKDSQYFLCQGWLTETGKPSAKDNYNELMQAEYLSSICSTFKPLVSKIFIYELKDNPTI